jgi:uncharacterized protein with von Willebrand factor type A (vWA) domain
MSKNLIYKPSAFHRHQWKYYKKVEPDARTAERIGEDRYEKFPDFSEEIFHSMYADKPNRVEEPAPGTEIFQKLDQEINKIPEVADLAKRCKGDERWSGIATTAIIDELMKSVPAPDGQVKDPSKDEQVIQYLERLLDNMAEGDKDAEHMKETLENAKNSRDEKIENNIDAANSIDESDIRNALRKAAKGATDNIEAEQNMIDSFSAGEGTSSNRLQRKAIARKLRKVISGNKRMQKIAELAGRLRRVALEQQRQKPRKGTDEVTGIELGDNLSRLIPSEAIFMEDDLEVIFARKYNERALLNTELNKNPPKEQGPIIMLLDSSGSMSYNNADAWAAAVCLAFLEIAKKQKRAFSIVHFGGDVRRTDKWKAKGEWGIDSILEAVSFFACDGGTNFMQPINEGIRFIREEGDFKKADLIMVTDGEANVSPGWEIDYNKAKEDLEFSTYSILVGSSAEGAKKTCEKFSDEVVFLADAIKEEKNMFEFFKKV